MRPTAESQRVSWASPWGPPWGTRRATGTTAQHHPAGPPHPDPAQNLVKHKGFEQPTQTSACGATSQARLELINGRAQNKSEETARDATKAPRKAREKPKNHESRRYGGHFWVPLAARKRTPKGPPRHPWGTRRATGTTAQHHPTGPSHPDPAQNLVKHEGFEQPTQASSCGSTSQAHLELIKERGQKRQKKACKTPPSTPKDASETPKTTNHEGTVAPSGRPWPRTKDPKQTNTNTQTKPSKIHHCFAMG